MRRAKEEPVERVGLTSLFVIALSVSVVALPTYSDDYALSCDGVDDFLAVGDSDSLDLTTGMTLEAWILPAATDQGRCILSKWDDGTGDWSYNLKISDTGDQLRLLLSQGNQGDLADVTGATSVAAGTWVHVAATYDGSQARIYYNGVLDGGAAASGAIQVGAANLLVGAANGGGITEAFAGTINEVRIWNVARSEGDIQSTMHAALAGDEPGLVAYWNFNAGAPDSQTVTDRSPNGNAGVLGSTVDADDNDPIRPRIGGAGPIQAAIDAAEPGARVTIGRGEYVITEPITFRGKDVVLRAFYGPGETVVRMATPTDPTRASVVIFENGESEAAVFDGFTLMEGKGTRWNGGSGGGGMLCLNDSSPTVVECRVTGNHVEGDAFGGGLACTGGAHPVVEDCEIIGNSAGQDGGGVWCGAASAASILDCLIAGNTALGGGGGVACASAANPGVSRCTIIGNAAFGSGGGGALCADNAAALFTNCVMAGNWAAAAGGALLLSESSPSLMNCTVSGNVAAIGDGGVSVTGPGSSPPVTNSIVWGNTPESVYGEVTFSITDDDPLFVQSGTFDCTRFTSVDVNGDLRQLPDFVLQEPDFHLEEGSPAIDAGTSAGAPALDADSTPRPCGAGVDIGAFELCQDIIIDNGDPGTVADGQWGRSLGTDAFGENSLYSNDVGERYSFEVALSGIHMVYVWWTEWYNRCTEIEIEVYSGSTLLDTVVVNQREDGGQWNLIGTYPFVAVARVVIVSTGVCTTCADAVRFVPSQAPVTFVVDPSGEAHFEDIQSAIDAVRDGDGVLVKPGEYEITAPLDFNRLHDPGDPGSPPLKNIRVRSEAGPDQTVIRMAAAPDDPARGSVVVFENGETEDSVLEGFTITGGQGIEREGDVLGGGIVCAEGCSPAVVGCHVSGNEAQFGGGLFCAPGSSPAVTDVTFEENQAALGGGVYCEPNASLSLTSATFSGNGATEDGGGLYVGGSVACSGCMILGNGAVRGGGVFCSQEGVADVVNSLIAVNGATESGGGVFVEGLSKFMNVTIAGNAAEGAAGGVECGPGAAPTVTNTILWDNVGEAIVAAPGSNPVVTFSCVEGSGVFPGEGNLNEDPRFLQPAQRETMGTPHDLADDTWVAGDHRLKVGSPAIDQGTAGGAPTDDITGAERPCGSGVDIGAYESCGSLIVVSPLSHDFGSVYVGDSAVLTFTIMNEGVEDLDVTAVEFDAAMSPLCAVTSNPPPLTVGPGDTTTVEVTYSPAEAGADQGALLITSNDPVREVAEITLQGVGLENQAPVIPSDPVPPDGAITDAVSILLTWTSGDPDGGHSVTYDVYFGMTQDPPLVSAGQAPATYDPGVLSGGTVYYWRIVATDNLGASTEGPLWQFETCDADIEISDTQISFDGVFVGQTATAELTISNTGCVALSVTLTPPADPFRIEGPLAYTLGRDENVVVTVFFEPPDLGDYASALLVESTDAGEPQIEVAVAGAGIAPPDITVDPAAVDFEEVPIGETPTRTVTIGNQGTGDLNVSAIGLSAGTSPDFTLTGGTAAVVLAPGETVSVTIQYAPSNAGADSGVIEVESNDPDTPVLAVPITGGGNQPPAAPRSPSPPDGATDQPANTILGWTGGDPDEGDTVTYDVYFGATMPPPVVASGQAQTTYVPDTVADDTEYYWRIVATDNRGASTEGPLWSFRSAANLPPTVDPSSDIVAGNAPVTIQFSATAEDADGSIVAWSWDFGDGAVSTDAAPSHQYEEVGSYVVIVTVRDDDGAEAMATLPLTVVDPATTILAAGAIGPAGGTLEVLEGELSSASVTVPAGALAEETVIVIGSVANPPAFEAGK